ncbi:hypothetical protein PUNSTDRAFT_131440 [Punctularia strigosozonata HHB-11173 SS5]|uniref:uncharacterized protein n=1 Tax=Punctularia strigosozonata (strain HHB-11173) TaxID=741275 RepID=UPI00044186A2|nr:uncharacterized protein PUNSTDRAFT_131440 [Punctularia strigosozonata HHB-11173 SS5]EIN11272.1 hypothetical protein PUNSTDRAFT_131440 [Punctularia strigosozonata HHB-11173 SS5]
MPGKDVTLWTHQFAPNGWKMVLVLNLLGLSYEYDLEFSRNSRDTSNSIRTDSRIPTLIDQQNGNFVIWESNAILRYLGDTYDKDHKISVTGPDRHLTLLRSIRLVREFPLRKTPSAVERCQKETLRVLGVLESVLSKQDRLVGGKMTIADASFVMWNEWLLFARSVRSVLTTVYRILARLDPDHNIELNMPRDFPAVHAWHQKMTAFPEIKESLALRLEISKEFIAVSPY